MSRFRGCSSSSVRFCSAKREASGSGRGNVLQLVQEPQAQQSRPFPAGAQLSLELLFSGLGNEMSSAKAPETSPAAPTCGRILKSGCLRRGASLSLLPPPAPIAATTHAPTGRGEGGESVAEKNSSLVIQVKGPRKEERKIYRKENTISIMKIATVTLILKQTPVMKTQK
ncbi:uncharacterized protein LOC116812004 [Hylobates moloch]|uniref:uncharacterized protein LOC116812004 n=1 Tax=Hylobates moloch TaxID=81572 RepID=UPI0013F277CF|nr:uncharacterized protein LOC116812004 [Hylobates moloch]